ncbi:hypothetical protein [Streptomyces olivochromogenes]|uniref:Uncharacterized protein n=1 Tax=Streptomyces olivochromogenes TaxID=1963 RepID=A0A286PG61_STROL|nr:hypothetical protein [Streptomyces olivochromogenes]GAX58540.1 hypothetical protein SO3561_10113 [Streptomyces olivochromogenes]
MADTFRAAAVRDHNLHHTDASLHKSGLISMIFLYLMTLAIALLLVWLVRSRRNAQELYPLGLGPESGLDDRHVVHTGGQLPCPAPVRPRHGVRELRVVQAEARHDTGEPVVGRLDHPRVGARAGGPGGDGFLVVAEALVIAAAVLLGLVIKRITASQGAALGATVPVAPLAQA